MPVQMEIQEKSIDVEASKEHINEAQSEVVGGSSIRPTEDCSTMLPNSFNKDFEPSDASSFRSEVSDVSGLSAMDADSTYDTASMASKRKRRRLKGDTVSNLNYGGENDDSVFTVDENESVATNYDQSDASFMPSKEKARMIKDMQASMAEDRSYNVSAISNLSDMSRMSAVPGDMSSMSMGNRSARMMDGNDSSFIGSTNSGYSSMNQSQSAMSDVKSIGMGASIDDRSYNESKLTFNYELSQNNYDESGLSDQGSSNISDISDMRSIKSLGLKYMIDENASLLSGMSNMSKKPPTADELKSMRSRKSNVSSKSSVSPSVFSTNKMSKLGSNSELSNKVPSMHDNYNASELESISPSAFGSESIQSSNSRSGVSSFQDDNTFLNSISSRDQSISPSEFNSNSGFELSNASAMSRQSKTSNKSDNRSIGSKKSSKSRTKKDIFDDNKLKRLNEKIEQRKAPTKPIKRKHNESSEDSSISIDYDDVTVASQSALSGISDASGVSGLSALSTTTYDSAVKNILQDELNNMEMSGISQLSENVPQLGGKYTKKLKALDKMNKKEDNKLNEDKKAREIEKKNISKGLSKTKSK